MSSVKTSLLDDLTSCDDLRQLPDSVLPKLAEELREEVINAVSVTGGHLGAGLGVVELTIALHHTFNTPHDRLIWDVGHQAYPHKILTGRRSRIRTLRQGGGLSGFTKRSESVYDPFGAAHASTSISAGLGMAVARDLDADLASQEHKTEEDQHIICVIGDGSMSAGMAYEAMNNAGALQKNLIVILNDNNMSIAPPVGAMSAYLARLVSSHFYQVVREFGKHIAQKLPTPLYTKAQRLEEFFRGLFTGGTLFEELGFYYVGPVDGHNFQHLLPVLRNVKHASGPILVHVVTQKGKGYPPAESSADKYHGVSAFNVATGAQKSTASTPTYTDVFAHALIEEARHDSKIVAITAAMPSGTGLDHFGTAFPKRMFDVGIAEQHAVTFAAGLAAEGYKPFCAIYSTFLQRGYDQVVHDVAIQNLPVRFAIDRAGLVGADGPTHAGSFDVTYLACLPNMVVMAPSDGRELANAVVTATAYNEGPIAFRYPRGSISESTPPNRGEVLPIGQGRIVQRGHGVALLSLGTRLKACLEALELLKPHGICPTIADARFVKPLDEALILDLATNHSCLITVEEGSIGGFGSHVLHFLTDRGALDQGTLKVRSLCLPDVFIEHDTMDRMYKEAQLDADSIAKAVHSLFIDHKEHRQAS